MIRQDHVQVALRTSCRAPTGSPPLTISCHLALPKRTIQDGPARRSVTHVVAAAPRSHPDRPRSPQIVLLEPFPFYPLIEARAPLIIVRHKLLCAGSSFHAAPLFRNAGARLPNLAEVEEMRTLQTQDGRGVGELRYLQALTESLRRSPTRLLELCAPEPFYFRVTHNVLGCITGFAVYMPVAEGVETKDLVQLHRGSVAFCFWKGRQMPYAQLEDLLPFMTKGTSVNGSSVADGKRLRERVRLMLFFGSVAQVDDCKFKFNDDIEEQLKGGRRNTDGTAAVDPYTNFQQWTRTPTVKKWTRGGAANISKDFERWLSTSTTKYDRTCELFDEIKAVRLPGRVKGKLEFRNLTFGYDANQPVLKDVSFDVKPGEKLAIVGPTGSGKSTLIRLLGRFYDFSDDRIFLDGHDLNSIHSTEVRRRIGVVMQDFHIFSGSILENIVLGNQSITRAAAISAAKSVNAHEFIEALPDGYDTELVERGQNLSQGQRQLLAFARVLASDPEILILDEATASIDTETEQLIQEALEHLMQGRTSILIAHRLQTIETADRVLVLKDGKVKELGTHQELMALRGVYYTLTQLQFQDVSS